MLSHVCRVLKPNKGAVHMFQSLPAHEPVYDHDPHFTAPVEAPLKMNFVMQQIQHQLLAGDEPMAVLVDTGDSLFRWASWRLWMRIVCQGRRRELQGRNGNYVRQQTAPGDQGFEELPV